MALIYFFQALQFVGQPDVLAAFDTDQLQAQALVALDSFNSTWLIGLVAFGVHLTLLGFLVLSSGEAPRALGYLLMAAGAAYMFDTFAHSLLSNYDEYAGLFLAVVAIPSILAEGWFGLWLLLRGGRSESVSPGTASL